MSTQRNTWFGLWEISVKNEFMASSIEGRVGIKDFWSLYMISKTGGFLRAFMHPLCVLQHVQFKWYR